ncbi:MAG TPA: ABC transporter permease [Puia sp.]|jgi:ABC-type antimicrobial peptide transport system permease subunit|nr:ABC transporter permease [Puia sp.]
MLRNYFRLALRHLRRDKIHSLVNITGLAIGMATVLLIAAWINDECSYEKYNPNYDRIARIVVSYSPNGDGFFSPSTPYPLADDLRSRYGDAFTRISRSWWTQDRVLAFGTRQLKRTGKFMEPDGPGILALNMLKGSPAALSGPSAVFLSASTAKALFGDTDPIGKIMTIDVKMTASVRGIYEDLPDNSEFNDVQFIGSWQLFVDTHDFILNARDNWGFDNEETYVQLAPKTNSVQLSARLRNSIMDHLKENKEAAAYHPRVAVDPMERWHLYSTFTGNESTKGLIQFVWLFGTIGGFVLLLACINFMNLSTARSERRAKEVGIRKTIGSGRGRLIAQFYGESLLMSVLAFILAILLAAAARPFFESLAGKKIGIQWSDPRLWAAAFGFCIFTALLAGSYPAIFLSSFRPVSVLKRAINTGRKGAAFRRTLVVLQFSISVLLIIGTIVVFRQIGFTKDRPVGYDRQGLLSVLLKNPADIRKLPTLRQELLRTGAVTEMSRSSTAATQYGDEFAGFSWSGKDPAVVGQFSTINVSPGYGQTINWKVAKGRDFSPDLATDSSAVVINEAAVSFMGLQHPIGEKITDWNSRQYTIIGVVSNVVAGSPYDHPERQIYFLDDATIPDYTWLFIRMKPGRSIADALSRISATFKSILPNTLFDYQFVDEEYGKKFAAEEHIGLLAATFALLALLISGLGIFGMASFMAERRTKEIGVRKVLGATILQIWQLLSKEFVVLVGLSFLIAMPAAFYLMHQWLQRYPYHSGIPWWIFASTAIAVLFITMLTVSFQSVKAALANPVNSLRQE